jgi:hypothetical protein
VSDFFAVSLQKSGRKLGNFFLTSRSHEIYLIALFQVIRKFFYTFDIFFSLLFAGIDSSLSIIQSIPSGIPENISSGLFKHLPTRKDIESSI